MEKIKELFKKYEEVIMYIVMGALTTLVYMISRLILRRFIPVATISTGISNIIAITFAFFANKKYVFKSETTTALDFFKQMVSFYLARGFTLLLDLAFSYLCVDTFGGFFIDLFGYDKIDYTSNIFTIAIVKNNIGSPEALNEFIFMLIAQVTILITNYVLSKLIVFRKKKEPAEKAS